MAKRVVKPFEGKDALLSINVFLPGYPPEEIKLKISNFSGCAFGAHKKPEGFKQDLINALKSVYGNNVK